jgi:anti-sigma B factor antagonist
MSCNTLSSSRLRAEFVPIKKFFLKFPPRVPDKEVMKCDSNQDLLHIADIKELSAANSDRFRNQVRAHLTEFHRVIEVDQSETTFLDSCGLGALVALYKTVCGRKGILRVLNPSPPVQKILKLTRMHRIFEIRSL